VESDRDISLIIEVFHQLVDGDKLIALPYEIRYDVGDRIRGALIELVEENDIVFVCLRIDYLLDGGSIPA